MTTADTAGGVVLGFPTTIGLGAIAAALGTASGFLALGVSYALSEMIEDAVAGVYRRSRPSTSGSYGNQRFL